MQGDDCLGAMPGAAEKSPVFKGPCFCPELNNSIWQNVNHNQNHRGKHSFISFRSCKRGAHRKKWGYIIIGKKKSSAFFQELTVVKIFKSSQVSLSDWQMLTPIYVAAIFFSQELWN